MIYEFAATQDLHGYEKPWAAGEGKNKADFPTDVSLPYSELITTVFDAGEDITVDNLVLSFFLQNAVSSNGAGAICDFKKDDGTHQYRVGGLFGISEGQSYTGQFSHSENNITFRYLNVLLGASYIYFTQGTASVQLEMDTSTATAFAPYANVCMPEGFNIWDPDNAEYVQVYAGYVNANTRELYLRPWYTEYAGEELVGPWMSSLDEYSEDATPTEGAFVIDFGGELTSLEITPFMLQTLLDSLGIRQHFTNGAGLLNSLMDQAQGRVRSEEELLHLSRPLNVIAIGDQLPAGITFKPISKDVLPGLPGKFIR